MIKWISVETEPLPRDGGTYLVLWKGQFGLAAFDTDIDRFYLQMLPGQYTQDWVVSKEREGKFTHWAKLIYPKDY